MLDPATDEQREGVLLHLRELVSDGTIDLEHFPMTPAHRRLLEPLVLTVGTGSLKMQGRWQVGATTTVRVAAGSALLDLTEAELDDVEIEMSIWVATGRVKVIVPHGIDLQLVGISGTVKSDLGRMASLPGAPIIRLTATAVTGTIRLRRPKVPKDRWWHRRPRDE